MNRSIETQKLVNEKTIQRYIFEEFNYGNKNTIKKFYPAHLIETLNTKNIKIIIPNYPIDLTITDEEGKIKIIQHIADFRVIYDDNTFHNIEVEWITSRFDTHSEVVYNQCYKDGKGFIIVFENDSYFNPKISYILSKDVKRISPEEFSYWYTFKSKNIVDETISNYIPNYVSRFQKVWLIYLPNNGANRKNSKIDYIKVGRKKGKWAFNYSNKGKIMKNILDICVGDIVIFIWGLTLLNGTHQRQINLDNDWYVSGIEVVKVNKGYYCNFNDETFETEDWKLHKIVEEKKYMHYFNFDRKYLYTSLDDNETKNFFYKDSNIGVDYRNNKLKGVIDGLNWSLNTQGAPSEIKIDDYNSLLVHLGSI